MSDRIRVLLVEDDEDSREVIAEVLSGEYEVTTAASAEEGLETYLRDRPDVVVTDQTLPGATGTTLAREVKNIEPSAKVVLVSGYGHVAGSEICDAVLEKPVELEALTEAIGSNHGDH